MSKKEEAVEQLKNCEDMHIWVQPIKEYIKKLEAKSDRLKKVEELLELYQLKDELKEHYAVNDSVLKGQEILDRLRQVCEEINIKEKELEELK